MADQVIGPARTASGVVWLRVRVDGIRFEIGAVFPGEWNLSHLGPISKPTPDQHKARKLAEQWERDHAADVAQLFTEAAEFRKSKTP
jgi:hypothetical protein